MWGTAMVLLFLSQISPFNNMRTLPANPNPIFGGSSLLPTTVERPVIKSLSTVQTTKQIIGGSSSFQLLPNNVSLSELCSTIWLPHARKWLEAGRSRAPKIGSKVAKNAFVGWALNFTIRMLLKGAVNLVPLSSQMSWKVLLPFLLCLDKVQFFPELSLSIAWASYLSERVYVCKKICRREERASTFYLRKQPFKLDEKTI